MTINYSYIIEQAWKHYDSSRKIKKIEDISVNVSTNKVFRVTFEDDDMVVAKLSRFGSYEYFKEDHRIIHSLGNNLLYPFENLLAKSLVKNNRVYTYRHRKNKIDAWVVFYNPIRFLNKFPRRLEEKHIKKFGEQIGKFHKACSRARNVLPKSSQTLRKDIYVLLNEVETNEKKFGGRMEADYVKYHCEQFLKNRSKCNTSTFEMMPVFIDWNIGNFSVTDKMELYSRWDYDWFRISYRVMDFYFFSRVVSDVGDKTVFSYVIDPMMEDRFILFLEEYHKVYPLTADEIRFMREVYRFFILNYVIKDTRHFFAESYSKTLRAEAFKTYLPSVDRDFDPEYIIKALKIKN